MTKAGLQRGLLDHVLALVGCVFATYSLGISVAKPVLGMTLAGMSVFSVMVGSLLSRAFAKSKIIEYDGWFAALFGLTAVFFVLPINRMLPEDGFPIELIAGCGLSLLVIFSGFAAWRDGTLLFLSLPCIAMFGLVGTFDVYKPATALFFAFLVCTAVLYSRIFLRSMSERAEKLGADTDLLRRDAWKWVAGPEWAFASAGVIVMFSLVAGPLLQVSLQSVSGQVRVNLPQHRASFVPAAPTVAPVDVRISNGPVNLSDALEFKIKMDEARYLRTRSYATYRSPGWVEPFDTLNPDFDLSINSGPVDRADDGTYTLIPGRVSPFEKFAAPKEVLVTLRPAGPLDSYLPAPGPIVGVAGDGNAFVRVRYDGAAYKVPMGSGDSVSYVVQVDGAPGPGKSNQLPEVIRSLGSVLASANSAPAKVRAFAAQATEGLSDPYQKAMAIKRAIESTTKYNTQVPPCPADRDPVEWFLFEKKEGYCDSFASAMALCARAVGLPSRYTIGYAPDAKTDAEGYYDVRAKDAHAWCEIYFEGHGWVVFDPTEGAPTVGEAGQNESDQTPWYEKPVGKAVLIALATACLAVPVFMWAWFLAAARQASLRGDPNMVRLVWAQNEFQKSMERVVGRPRRFSQTIRAYVASHMTELGQSSTAAADLADRFERLMFSGVSVDAAAVKDMQSQVRGFRASLPRKGRSNG
ncbi:MAG: transglutaminase domain-containing protein [Fimbriimonadaceae bacterium]|nr:transglutaminase domain-containing protein [Fimbriimonadaceae bacterium]